MSLKCMNWTKLLMSERGGVSDDDDEILLAKHGRDIQNLFNQIYLACPLM